MQQRTGVRKNRGGMIDPSVEMLCRYLGPPGCTSILLMEVEGGGALKGNHTLVDVNEISHHLLLLCSCCFRRSDRKLPVETQNVGCLEKFRHAATPLTYTVHYMC